MAATGQQPNHPLGMEAAVQNSSLEPVAHPLLSRGSHASFVELVHMFKEQAASHHMLEALAF